MREPIRSKPDGKTINSDVNPLHQKLDDARLLGREQLIPERIELMEGCPDLCLGYLWVLVPRREGSITRGERGVAYYRPEIHDVLVYDTATDVLGLKASTKGEKALYRSTVGRVLFGNEAYFGNRFAMTLGPVTQRGPGILACADVKGLQPLSALDARVRARLRGEIRDLQRRLGITTIMVTHDQEEALTMSDRIVVMSKGRIDQIGTPEEIYARPATPFVADFVGKMNFLDGRLSRPNRADMNGATLELDRPVPIAAGTPVTVCMRPEDVVVRNVRVTDRNALQATVGVMEFIGNHFATTLHVPDTKLSLAADLSMNDVRDLGIGPGRTILVALPPDRLRVFAGNHAV